MYPGRRNRRQLGIINEARDLLTQENVAVFIEHGFQRFRKYGGAAGFELAAPVLRRLGKECLDFQVN